MPHEINQFRRRFFSAAAMTRRSSAAPSPSTTRITSASSSTTIAGASVWLKAEPSYDALENRLAAGPVIIVPTITLEGDANGAPHPAPAAYAAKFIGKYVHRNLTGGIGHNLPQEAPQAFAAAVIDVDAL